MTDLELHDFEKELQSITARCLALANKNRMLEDANSNLRHERPYISEQDYSSIRAAMRETLGDSIDYMDFAGATKLALAEINQLRSVLANLSGSLSLTAAEIKAFSKS